MKNFNVLLVSLLVFIGFSQSLNSQSKPDMSNLDLYLLIGQSNMAGRGVLEDAPYTDCGIYSLNKDNQWVVASDPLHFDKKEAGVGLGLSFAETLKMKNPDRSIGLIPCAVGGTSISKWKPGVYDNATGTYPYDQTVARLKMALNNGHLKGILWHQGESDSSDDNYKYYETRFDNLLSDLSKDLNINLDTIPIIIGELGEFLTDKTNTGQSKEINEVLHKIANNSLNIYCVKSDGLTDKGDKLHFNSKSARELGKRYAQAYETVSDRIKGIDKKWQRIPIDNKASVETIDLYNKLFSSLDRGIMFGHQDALAYGHQWYKEAGRSDVKDMIGDYPAIIGFELGHIEIEKEYNLDSVYFSDMKQYTKDTHLRGGIVTFSWHGNNIVTGGTSWDCNQDFVVRSVLPDGINHARYLVWLDRLADFFLDLEDERGIPIPVIFRMYHEHTGDWFWWCSKQCTPDEYKQLWIMTVKYLRDERGVHNLLYSYSSSNIRDESHYLERYPGDNYVDILGFDHYLKGKTVDDVEKYKIDFERNIKVVTDYAAKSGKLPIIGETGEESIWDTTYFTQVLYPIINKYKVAWILFWRNAWEPDKPNHYYLPFKGHPSENDFKEFISMPNILMNKDIIDVDR